MTQEQQRWFGQGPSGALAQEALVCSARAVRGVLDRPGYGFWDPEVLANLRAVSVLAAVVEAVKLVFVAELDDRPQVVLGGVKGGGAMAFLTEGLNQSRRQACRDLAAAQAVASGSAELPLLGQALAEGAVSREHVDVAVATVRRIPKVLKTKVIEQPPDAGEAGEGEPAGGPAGEGGPVADPAGGVPVGGGCRRGVDVIDEVLTGQARHLPPTTIDRLGRQIVHRLDPDRAQRFDADADQRRSCSIGSDFAGMGLYRLVLDPVTHLQVRAAIAKFAAPRPAGTATTVDGRRVPVRDTRTPGQRQADAIADLILRGAGAGSTLPPPTRPEPTHPEPTHPEPTHPEPTGAQPAGAEPVDGQETDDAAARGPAGENPPAADTDGQPPTSANDCDTDDVPDDDVPDDDVPDDDVPDDDVPDDDVPDDDVPEDDVPDDDVLVGEDCEEEVGVESHSDCQGGGGMIPPAFGAPSSCAVEMLVISTLDQLAAAHQAADPAAAGAGLARICLAGRIGDYPGSTLNPDVLARLSCDGPIRRVLLDPRGAVLHHGRARRLATRAQRQALAARDAGCAIPGCAAPPEWSDVHHVIAWEHGGLTDIDAMVLLCGRHHTALHAGVYQIQMRHGLPWVQVPAWQDPTRPWLRNTTHDHPQIADTTARALLTGQTPPTAPPTAPPPTAPQPGPPRAGSQSQSEPPQAPPAASSQSQAPPQAGSQSATAATTEEPDPCADPQPGTAA